MIWLPSCKRANVHYLRNVKQTAPLHRPDPQPSESICDHVGSLLTRFPDSTDQVLARLANGDRPFRHRRSLSEKGLRFVEILRLESLRKEWMNNVNSVDDAGSQGPKTPRVLIVGGGVCRFGPAQTLQKPPVPVTP